MRSENHDRKLLKGIAARAAGALVVMLAAAGSPSGAAEAPDTAHGRGPSEDGSTTAQELPALERFQVVRNGFSKKIRFREEATDRTLTMKYKGIPWSRGSAINLVADRDRYEKDLHRVRYRFSHPLTGEPLVLKARSTSQRLRKVPIRSENTAPEVQVFEGDSQVALGALTYDSHSKTLFAGHLRERAVEIERVSEDSPLDWGLLKYFLFPFPVTGDYVVRIDGEPTAWFSQGLAKGVKSPYELALATNLEPRMREDAMLAFILFDLMGDFVDGAG